MKRRAPSPRTTTTISSRVMGYAVMYASDWRPRARRAAAGRAGRSRPGTALARAEAGRDESEKRIPERSAVALAEPQLDLAEVTFHRMQDLLHKGRSPPGIR